MEFKGRIHEELRFPLVWTIFFIIIGIILQSIQSSNFVFLDFFGKNYALWFKAFGNFVTLVDYTSPKQFISAIMGRWYYFFYTAGILALIWRSITIIINSGQGMQENKPKEVYRI